MSWWKVNCGFKVNKMKQYSHHDHTERQYKQQDGNHGLFSNKPKNLGSQLSLTDAPGHLPMWLHIIRSTFWESCASGRTDSEYEAQEDNSVGAANRGHFITTSSN
jgi:hypothetical protein